MKLAHVVLITPRKCGLYETTRELCAAARAAGHDARMVDPRKPGERPHHPGGEEDRGAVFAEADWLRQADVIIDHSGCDGSTDEIETPHIMVAHGRPRHSFNSERDGGPPIYSYQFRVDRTPKYKAVVTFWHEHLPQHRVMFKRVPVHYVPSSVDLKAWTPEGPTGYDFHGRRGQYNIVITDSWRDDVDPYEALNASILAAREVPGTKIHLYGKGDEQKGWGALLNVAKADGTLGEVCGWVGGLDNVYRAASLLVTPNAIATRAVRESMACGCPHVSAWGLSDMGIVGRIVSLLKEPPTRSAVRQEAERRFNPLNTARAFLAIAEAAC